MCTLISISWMGNPRVSYSLSSYPSIFSTFLVISSSSMWKSGWWCGSYHTTWSNGGWVGVGELFCFYDWMKTLMPCTLIFLKWNMPNEYNFVLTESKRNESTREVNNAHFDTSLATTPKSDEPRYCNKNAANPKATNFNYQLKVHTNLRGIDTICATYNVSFLYCHDVTECMY